MKLHTKTSEDMFYQIFNKTSVQAGGRIYRHSKEERESRTVRILTGIANWLIQEGCSKFKQNYNFITFHGHYLFLAILLNVSNTREHKLFWYAAYQIN